MMIKRIKENLTENFVLRKKKKGKPKKKKSVTKLNECKCI